MINKLLNSKQISVSVILIAITLIMGFLKWGFIPLEMYSLLGSATLMHIPIIIAGICAGPLVGAVAGIIFGCFSMKYFHGFNYYMYFLPRILIGPVAYLSFILSMYLLTKIKNINYSVYISSIIASCLATLTNTFGVLLIGYYFNILTIHTIRSTFLTNGIPELIVSIIIIPPIVIGLNSYIKS